ncbi:MAG TPA: SAM-dependent methyltransferase [Streptosporangiaceae bacterium]|nr:SAM-dependent methyltransferase [Streptosporangiaceae bacterium]
MDLDSGPSLTAQRVAAHRLSFARPGWPHGNPAADDALAADVVAGSVTGQSPGGGQAPREGRMHDHLAARTAFFDQAVLSALDDGIRQVVVGAAGYDGRAFRFAAPGVRWFEVDHPATQADKLARLDRLGVDASEVRFVPADFAVDPLATLLTTAGLDPGGRTLFLLEGVAVYLPEEVLRRVLTSFAVVAAVGSRLAISMPDSGSLVGSTRFRDAVAALGEPIRSRFTPDSARALLTETGWPPADASTGLVLAVKH